MKIRCLVVDDERLAQDVLIHHISKFEILELLGVCNNIFELITFLNKDKNVDLVFLDIKMPEISGTDFVNMFNNPPAIIYTTAYNQYAVDAFNQNAIDYLLKLISLDRFSKSVQKATQIIEKNKIPIPIPDENNSFFVRSEKRLVQIEPQELFYIEGMGNYLCLYTEMDKIVLHSTLMSIEENFKHLEYICRVHKSYFVNLKKINYVEQHVAVLRNNKSIPIGLNYRNTVYEKLKILQENK